MKKIFVMALAMSLVGIVGCDNKKKTESAGPAIEPPPATPQPYIPPAASNPPAVTMTPVESSPMTTPAPEAPAHHAAATHSGTGSKKTTASAASVSTSSGKIKPGSTYVVKKGDSLSEIAKWAYGSASKKNIDKIKKANKITSDVVKIGQKLKIPA